MINKRSSIKYSMIGIVVILVLMGSFLCVPTAYAEERSLPMILEEITEGRYKITVNRDEEFSDEEILASVADLDYFLNDRSSMNDGQKLNFYNKLKECDFLYVTPTFYSKILGANGEKVSVRLSRDEYNSKKRVRSSWNSDNGYLNIATMEWVSSAIDQEGYKDILFQTAVYWKIKPQIWNRNDYAVFHWSNNATYNQGSKSGMVNSSATKYYDNGEYYENILVNNCKSEVSIDKYIVYKGKMDDPQNCLTTAEKKDSTISVEWDYSIFYVEAKLRARENFSYKVHYFHDQGILPYLDIINKISVSVGVVSIPGGFLTNLKEYASDETTTVYI